MKTLSDLVVLLVPLGGVGMGWYLSRLSEFHNWRRDANISAQISAMRALQQFLSDVQKLSFLAFQSLQDSDTYREHWNRLHSSRIELRICTEMLTSKDSRDKLAEYVSGVDEFTRSLTSFEENELQERTQELRICTERAGEIHTILGVEIRNLRQRHKLLSLSRWK